MFPSKNVFVKYNTKTKDSIQSRRARGSNGRNVYRFYENSSIKHNQVRAVEPVRRKSLDDIQRSRLLNQNKLLRFTGLSCRVTRFPTRCAPASPPLAPRYQVGTEGDDAWRSHFFRRDRDERATFRDIYA